MLLHWLDRDGMILKIRAANARETGKPEAAYRVADLAMEYARRKAPARERTLTAYAGQIREALRRAAKGCRKSVRGQNPLRHPMARCAICVRASIAAR